MEQSFMSLEIGPEDRLWSVLAGGTGKDGGGTSIATGI
jgi:hypothetical protein